MEDDRLLILTPPAVSSDETKIFLVKPGSTDEEPLRIGKVTFTWGEYKYMYIHIDPPRDLRYISLAINQPPPLTRPSVNLSFAFRDVTPRYIQIMESTIDGPRRLEITPSDYRIITKDENSIEVIREFPLTLEQSTVLLREHFSDLLAFPEPIHP